MAEIALGAAALYLFLNFPIADAAARFVFCAALLTVAMIDLDRWRIPLVITIPGIAIGLFAATVMIPETGFVSSIIGIVAGAGFLFIFGELYRKIRGRDGVGLGDVWLVGMVGAFLGWPGVLFTLFAGSLLGSICGLVYAISGRAKTPHDTSADNPVDATSTVPDSILLTAIPFGPFLALAAAIFALFQPQLSDWYLLG
jgi:leader peptidase (prepilin peptidase)/N-methyltransferase